MPEVVTYKFNLHKLSPSAQQLVKTAVMLAEQNRQDGFHKINIGKICNLAGFPALLKNDFFDIVREACKVKVMVETIDTLSLDRDDLPFSCWSLFEMVEITNDYFYFKIFNKTFDQLLIKSLSENSVCLEKKVYDHAW